MKKTNKSILIIILSIILIPLLILLMLRLSFIVYENKIHNEVVSFVKENIEVIKNVSTSKYPETENDGNKFEKFKIKKDNDFNDILNFNYANKGFAFSSSHYGFFYIPNNNINLYFDETFIKTDNKYNYKEKDSDNTIYLEKITDEIYYYKINY